METQLGYELKRTQQALRSSMDAALGTLSLTTPQYAALAVLDAAPRVSSAELARRCFVTPQTMQVMIGGLEQRGLVTRESRVGHGRSQPIELTRGGRDLVECAHRVVDAIELRLTAGFSARERRQLFDLLRRAAESVGEPSPGRGA